MAFYGHRSTNTVEGIHCSPQLSRSESFSCAVTTRCNLWESNRGTSIGQSSPVLRGQTMKSDKWRLLLLACVAVAILAIASWLILPSFFRHDPRIISPAARESIERLPLSEIRVSGGTVIGRSDNEVVIEGHPCASGWVHFDEAGRLKGCQSSRPHVISGIQIPAGTWISFNPVWANPNSFVCSFPEDIVVQGYTCKGSRLGSEGPSTVFYESGRLAAFSSREDAVIQGVTCMGSAFHLISLHENGNLKECTLANDEVIGGRRVSSGQTVVLNDGGEVEDIRSHPFFERTLTTVSRFF